MNTEFPRKKMTLGVDGRAQREMSKLSFGEISSNSTQPSGTGCLSNIPGVLRERGCLQVRGVRCKEGQKDASPLSPLCLDMDERG